MIKARVLSLVTVLVLLAATVMPIALAVVWSGVNSSNNPGRAKEVELGVAFGTSVPGYTTFNMSASYTIRHIRGGTELAVVKKDGDPLTIHFYRAMANILFLFIRQSPPLTWLDTGGTSRSHIDIENGGVNPLMHVAIGTGTGTVTPYRNAMFSMLTRSPVDSSQWISYSVSGSNYVVTITRSFTFTSSHTITEVALILDVDVDSGTGQTVVSLLVAHDLLPQPVQVVANDVLVVTYTITIPFSSSGPITRHFCHALINYMLGYTRATGTRLSMVHQGGSAGAIDTPTFGGSGTDTWSVEYLFLEVGNGIPGQDPHVIANLVSRITRLASSDPAFISRFTDISTGVALNFTVSLSFTSAQTIREVALSAFLDTDSTSGVNRNYYIWLYWYLTTPISVQAGDGLKFRVVIVFPYGI